MNIGICYYAFHRPLHTQKTLRALFECMGIENYCVYIFLDKAYPYILDEFSEETKVIIEQMVKRYPNVRVRFVKWKRHAGAHVSFTRGLEYALSDGNEAVIRVEDDILVRTDFLSYMSKMLELYQTDDSVFAIGSYNPSFLSGRGTFKSRIFRVWGMGVWKNRVENLRWGSELSNHSKIKDAIAVGQLGVLMSKETGANRGFYMHRNGFGYVGTTEDNLMRNYAFENHLYTVYADVSYCKNIGFDGSGENHPSFYSENLNFFLERELNLQKATTLSWDEEQAFSSSQISSYC